MDGSGNTLQRSPLEVTTSNRGDFRIAPPTQFRATAMTSVGDVQLREPAPTPSEGPQVVNNAINERTFIRTSVRQQRALIINRRR